MKKNSTFGAWFLSAAGGLALSTLLSAPAGASAPGLAPRMVPPKGVFTLSQDDLLIPSVVIKFHEGTAVRLRDGRLQQLVNEQGNDDHCLMERFHLSNSQVQADLGALTNRLPSQGGGLALRPLFTAPEPTLKARRMAGQVASGKELADLTLYVELALPPGTTSAQVRALVAALDALPSVETAYAQPQALPAATDIPPLTSDFQPEQRYLRSAPFGIDANYAWAKPGGNGAGVLIVDVEGAWQTTHEDLPAMFHTGGTQFPDVEWRYHGTAVLGEMVGVQNAYGVTGIANGAQVGFEGIATQGAASAITNAALAAGDSNVVLIELHRPGPVRALPCTCNIGQCNYIPVEFWQAEFDAIQDATVNGTIVVEAGGNGSANLDDAVYMNLFSPAKRDSGAIIVGASGALDRVPMCWTNYGNRVNVHGWGEGVTTLGYGDRFDGGGDENQFYTNQFSGTSSASPIVTASVASIQGALKSSGRFPLSPIGMRHLLTATGTSQAVDVRQIGPLPNLRGAFDRLRL